MQFKYIIQYITKLNLCLLIVSSLIGALSSIDRSQMDIVESASKAKNTRGLLLDQWTEVMGAGPIVEGDWSTEEVWAALHVYKGCSCLEMNNATVPSVYPALLIRKSGVEVILYVI